MSHEALNSHSNSTEATCRGPPTTVASRRQRGSPLPHTLSHFKTHYNYFGSISKRPLIPQIWSYSPGAKASKTKFGRT